MTFDEYSQLTRTRLGSTNVDDDQLVLMWKGLRRVMITLFGEDCIDRLPLALIDQEFHWQASRLLLQQLHELEKAKGN